MPHSSKTTYEYDPAQELLGMRDTNSKGFLTEDGRIAQLTSDEAIHYLDVSGAYEEIDLNIKATLQVGKSTRTFSLLLWCRSRSRTWNPSNQFVDPISSIEPPIIIGFNRTFQWFSMRLQPSVTLKSEGT